MDSEDSRPGSSASSSSSASSNHSGPSSPDPDNKNDQGPKSPTASPQISLDNTFRSRSPSFDKNSNTGRSRSRSRSKSNSASSESSSSSDDENNDANSQPKSKKTLARSSSEGEDSIKDGNQPTSHPRSPSPADSQRNFRLSSSSSNRSFSNGRIEADGDEVQAEDNISHEDLSDVSDMESEKRVSSNNNSKQLSDDAGVDGDERTIARNLTEVNKVMVEEQKDDSTNTGDLREKIDKKKETMTSENGKDNFKPNNGGFLMSENCNSNSATKKNEDLGKPHDEDALDFEAEEGECLEGNENDENQDSDVKDGKNEKGVKSDGEAENEEELEEGEVSDEEEKRPEETEPKPVCRFYTRGQCTWGMSCRFLHPGVTDKGNYTMFDLVRPVPVTHSASTAARPAGYSADFDYRTERPPLNHRPTSTHFASNSIYPPHHDPRAVIPEAPVVVESAWERGLRTAKEMMRKASKRKEQDMDFEDKKMNLPISQEELEKDSYYLKEKESPAEGVVSSYGRHATYHDVHSGIYSPPERFGRFAPPLPPYDDLDPYGRSARYRELPPHRMPQYEDERRVRPTREVIVQRVEPAGRGDEWNDPWMRSKSPGARAGSHDRVDRRRRDRRSYSSNSSYSSTTSSQSDSSSESSRSPSPADNRRRYNNNTQKTPQPIRRHGVHTARSISPVRRGRRSPAAVAEFKSDFKESRVFKDNELHNIRGARRSPLLKRRGGYESPSPTLDKRFPYSPAHKRKRLSPAIKKSHDKSKVKRHHTSSSSGSDSSDSSVSDSDSDTGSSSSDSSSRSRGKASRHAIRNVPGKVSIDKRILRKVEPPKKRSPITIEIKKPSIVGASALTSPTHSASSEKETKKSRREELLKQLRAVEDAIAKKRQKLA